MVPDELRKTWLLPMKLLVACAKTMQGTMPPPRRRIRTMADSRHQTHWATHFLKVKLELSGRSAPRSDNDTIKSEAVFGIHPSSHLVPNVALCNLQLSRCLKKSSQCDKKFLLTTFQPTIFLKSNETTMRFQKPLRFQDQCCNIRQNAWAQRPQFESSILVC